MRDMMKNNGLLKWTLNKNKISGGNGNNWVHPPDTLTNGHVAYLVKFLGVTETDQPKGIEVVKDSIRKLKLDEDIRRAEGVKTPKAEVTISVEGVAVQEPKAKKILHQFPLHQISYCADDKEEKKFFSFIAKDGDVHRCFVFSSDKLAEEITLTIGQAFDLAYKRFQDSSGRELELQREIMVLQKRVDELENENSNLREKLSLRSIDGHSNSSLSSSNSNVNVGDLLILPPVPPRQEHANVANQIMAEFNMTVNEIEKRSQVGRKLEELLIDDELFDSKPRGNPDGIEAPPRLSPPPKQGMKKQENGGVNDVFGADPFFTSNKSDPFGMTDFSKSTTTEGQVLRAHTNNNNQLSTQSYDANFGFDPFNTSHSKPIENALQILDQRIGEMRSGFTKTLISDDFHLEMLDPLRQSS